MPPRALGWYPVTPSLNTWPVHHHGSTGPVLFAGDADGRIYLYNIRGGVTQGISRDRQLVDAGAGRLGLREGFLEVVLPEHKAEKLSLWVAGGF